MFNLICGLTFVLVIFLSFILQKSKYKDLILQLLSFPLLLYKLIYYIAENAFGHLVIPVEISSISYFLMFIIILFRIKKLYVVGAFFGLLAGFGYFTFYTLFGFTLSSEFTIFKLLIGCFTHGYLLLCGIHLFINNKFEKSEHSSIWIAILSMLCWGLVFFDIKMRGITFIYYIVKPKFLFISSQMILNVLLLISYYAMLVTAFYFVIKLFFKVNSYIINKLKN